MVRRELFINRLGIVADHVLRLGQCREGAKDLANDFVIDDRQVVAAAASLGAKVGKDLLERFLRTHVRLPIQVSLRLGSWAELRFSGPGTFLPAASQSRRVRLGVRIDPPAET